MRSLVLPEQRGATLPGALVFVPRVALALLLGGCVSTTTSERAVGAPTTRLEQRILPGPPELEASVSRATDALTLELSRVRWCREQEILSVKRERIKKSKIGTGTAISSAAVMVVGVVAASVAVFAVGGGILVVSVLQTGTRTTPLADRETVEPGRRVVCRRNRAPGVIVQVASGDVTYRGTTDAGGRLEISELAPGDLRVSVDDAPVRVVDRGRRRTAEARPRPAEPAEPAVPGELAEPTEPVAVAPAPTPPKPAAPPAKPTRPKPPETQPPLPPPPPPPPGVRLFPE